MSMIIGHAHFAPKFCGLNAVAVRTRASQQRGRRATMLQHETLELADGAKIGYAVTGPADAFYAVLCFNPGGANYIAWEIAAELLAANGVRCILHDCRGLGSSEPAPYSERDELDAQLHFDQYAADARALLTHLGALDNVVVCGSSWGARPAAATVAQLGDAVAAAILFDISFGKAERPIQESGERLARDKCKRLGIVEPRVDFGKIAGAIGPNGKKSVLTTMATAKPPYGEAQTFLETFLAGATCPTLVAMGEFDPNLVARPGKLNLNSSRSNM